MVMETLQIRLTKGLVEEIQKQVDRGIYPSTSEAVRDAVRRMVVGSGELPKQVEKTVEKIQKEVTFQLMGARGTRDFLPEQQIVRERITSVLRETFELYGYSPLDTPLIERSDVLTSKYAGGAEILKEMFSLQDQGKRDLGLRYDLTVPLARVIGMNPQLKMPFKRYQIGQVFRDGPISLGRYRQFVQCDVDVVGCRAMSADAEIVALVNSAFSKLGFEIDIRINNRKILNGIVANAGIAADKIDGVILSIDKLEKFGEVVVKKELAGKGISQDAIDTLFDTLVVEGSNDDKLKKLQAVLKDNEGIAEISEVLSMVSVMGASCTFDPSLARGLSYYTGTIYETFLKDSKITSAVCSGGRYDEIIGQFVGRESIPAVGISFGLDRIYDALLEKQEDVVKTVTQVFVIPIGTATESMKLAEDLRKAGLKVDVDLQGRGISKNLKFANSMGIPSVVFLGQQELKEGNVKIRDMKSGEERMVEMSSVVDVLKKSY
ncbi:MAG: histidine--tRNA ligase [Nanoarchaeota archaeon]|nr:histidine--tRNA ligase [Nanoarchaeota archaeon]